MEIIDAHAHIFPSKIAEKATKSIGDFYDLGMFSEATSEKLLKAEKEAGIAKTLVCSSAVTASQVESINTFIADECAAHPEFIGFAAMHPEKDGFEEELDRAISLGLKGVKFHPDFQKFNVDDLRAIPVYEAIAKRGLPVLFHAGDNRYDYSSVERIIHLMELVPDLKVIAAHFGGYSQWDRTIHYPKSDHLWFDTSSSLAFLDKEKACELIRFHGVEHFFFGADFPMWNPTEELERFLSLPLTDDEREAIFHINFENAFGL